MAQLHRVTCVLTAATPQLGPRCVRKLAIVCMPVFLESGGAAQLIFGLIVCFITFGLYTYFSPYKEPHVNLLAQACQCQIFFALLTSIALKFAAAATEGQGESLIDIVLVVLTFVPAAVVLIFQTPARDIFYPEKRAKWFSARGDKEESAAASRDNQQSAPSATRLSSTPAESNHQPDQHLSAHETQLEC